MVVFIYRIVRLKAVPISLLGTEYFAKNFGRQLDAHIHIRKVLGLGSDLVISPLKVLLEESKKLVSAAAAFTPE